MKYALCGIAASSLLFLPLQVDAQENSLNHQLEYGVINFDEGLITQDLAKLPSILNYTYYFEDVGRFDGAIELLAHQNRVNWLQTNVFFNLGGVFNVSGQYYFDNGYDMEYQALYFSYDFDSEKHLNTGFLLNFPEQNGWQIGAGLRNHFSDEDDYRYINGEWVRTDDNILVDAVMQVQVQRSMVNDGIGWWLKSKVARDAEFDYSTLTFDATYFSSLQRSTSIKFGFYRDGEGSYKSNQFRLALAQKYWFSKTKAIDYGLVYMWEKEDSANYYEEDNWDVWLYELNGTYRF